MTNQPGSVLVKNGNAWASTIWGLISANKYQPVAGDLKARLCLSVAGSLSGLSAVDGVVPNDGDVILVTQGLGTDGLYYAHAGAWTLIALVSNMRSGQMVSVYKGNSAPINYMAAP